MDTSKKPAEISNAWRTLWAGYAASYRIACPGPNKGSAVAVFETTATTYRGSIKMNVRWKNMTMSETQVGRIIGNCQ